MVRLDPPNPLDPRARTEFLGIRSKECFPNAMRRKEHLAIAQDKIPIDKGLLT